MTLRSDVPVAPASSITHHVDRSYAAAGGGRGVAPPAGPGGLSAGDDGRPPRYRLTRRDKATWTAGVNGDCCVVRDMTGIGYIPTLVSPAYRRIDGVTLRGTDRNVVGPDFSRQDLADPDTIKDIQAELNVVDEAIADARTRQDDRGQGRLQERKEFLMKYVLEVAARMGCLENLNAAELDAACRRTLAVYRRTGRLNQFDESISDKAWHSVYSALDRGYAALRSAGEPGRLMAEHLRSAIERTSPHFVYSPTRPIPYWEL